MDMTFECPEIAEVSDAGGFAERSSVTGGVDAVGEALLADASAWIDPSCVSSCGGNCEEAACVTSAGATVTWRYTWAISAVSACMEGSSTVYPVTELAEAWDVTVVPPTGAGLDWSALTFTMERGAYVFEGYDCGSTGDRWSSAWSASWTGTYDPSWPADATVTGATSFWSPFPYPSAEGVHAASWDDPTCAWDVRWDSSDYEHLHQDTVAVAGQPEVFVSNHHDDACGRDADPEDDWAFLDGARVGVVDPTSWALTFADRDCDGVEDDGDTGDTGGTDTAEPGDTDTAEPGDTDTAEPGDTDTAEPGDTDTGSGSGSPSPAPPDEAPEDAALCASANGPASVLGAWLLGLAAIVRRRR